MGIVYSEKYTKFILTTNRTAYCLAIDSEKNLQHIFGKIKRQTVIAMQIPAIMSHQVHFDKARPIFVPVGPGTDGDLALEQRARLGAMTRLGTGLTIASPQAIDARRADAFQASIASAADLEHTAPVQCI